MKRTGHIAIVGRPNVGKSTLLNALLGEKISIITPKAQTTQRAILGIKTQGDTQWIYIDTPGIHQHNGRYRINRRMNRAAWAGIHEADLIVWVIEAHRWTPADQALCQQLHTAGLSQPVILVLNKIDKLDTKGDLLPVLAKRAQDYPFAALIPLSAREETGGKAGVAALEQVTRDHLPEAPDFLYPPDQQTVQTVPFRISELIREKLMWFLGDELPYVVAIQVQEVTRRPDPTGGSTSVFPEFHATIWVERDSQKQMVIGHKGALLKKIGSLARADLEHWMRQQIVLKLWVKVRAAWRNDPAFLETLGL